MNITDDQLNTVYSVLRIIEKMPTFKKWEKSTTDKRFLTIYLHIKIKRGLQNYKCKKYGSFEDTMESYIKNYVEEFNKKYGCKFNPQCTAKEFASIYFY